MKEEKNYLKVFQNNPEFYKEFLSRLDECINNFIRIISSHVKQDIQSNNSTYYILDIGGGNGNSMLRLLKDLNSISKTPIKLDYLEPSQEMYALFKQSITEKGFENVLNNSFVEKWEEHIPKRKYDFILSCESWFGIGNWSESLTKLYDSMKLGGTSCIVIESRNNDFIKFKRKFLPELYKDENIVYGELIFNVLDKLKIPYKVQTEVTQKLDISDLFPDENGEIPIKGRIFLSYLLRKNYDELDSNIKQRIKDYLLNNYDNKMFILENDFIWINKLD